MSGREPEYTANYVVSLDKKTFGKTLGLSEPFGHKSADFAIESCHRLIIEISKVLLIFALLAQF